MPITPCKYIGVGVIWNVTDNVELSNQAEMGFDFPLENIEIPQGSAFGVHTIPTQQKLTGRFGFRDLYSALLAASIAGTATTGAVKHISKEELTVPSSPGPYTDDLTQTPYDAGETYSPIRIEDEDGIVYKQVASVAAAGEFSVSTKTVTFHEDDADKTVYASYFWDDNSNGITVKMDPTSLPGHKCFMFAGLLYNTEVGQDEGYLVAVIKKVVRKGGFNSAPGVGDAATIGFDWEASVAVATDALFCFPVE